MYGKISSYDRIASITPNYDHNRKNRQNKKDPEKKFADILKEKNSEEQASPEPNTNLNIKYL